MRKGMGCGVVRRGLKGGRVCGVVRKGIGCEVVRRRGKGTGL